MNTCDGTGPRDYLNHEEEAAREGGEGETRLKVMMDDGDVVLVVVVFRLVMMI